MVYVVRFPIYSIVHYPNIVKDYIFSENCTMKTWEYMFETEFSKNDLNTKTTEILSASQRAY